MRLGWNEFAIIFIDSALKNHTFPLKHFFLENGTNFKWSD